MAVLTSLLILFVTLLMRFVFLRTVLKFRKHRELFIKHGIPYLGFSFKRIFQFFTGNTNLVRLEMETFQEAKATNARIVGITDMFGAQSVYIMDLDLLRNIYVKDFEYFVNRRPVATTQANAYFRRFLLCMEGEQWKRIRNKLSPSFTTEKIKRMFHIFKKSSKQLDGHLKMLMLSVSSSSSSSAASGSADVNLVEPFLKYAMDGIAWSAFGIDSKCWDVPPGEKSLFEKMGQQFQPHFSVKMMLKVMLYITAPKVMDMLGIDGMDYESGRYYASVIKNEMKRRRETGERKEDFLGLMMDAQQGILNTEEEDEEEELAQGETTGSGGHVTFDDEDIVANGMEFILAGLDPTQSMLLFTFYCLALNPEVQEKLYEEVMSAKEKNRGELTYQAILEMSYLDLVINETMRMYPPVARNERQCGKDYTVPGMNFVIPKGTIVAIPIHPVHHDERYFPNPDKFIPERFLPEEKAARHAYAFSPFGHGGRSCIGMQFALVKVKTVIAQLVSSYHFAPCSRTKIPVEFAIAQSIKPKGEMWLNVTQRN